MEADAPPSEPRRPPPPPRALRKLVASGFKAGAYVAARLREVRPRPAPSARRAAALRVIAHRGASAYAPENTLPAFRRAVELGVSEVELDVQLARDDVLMVFHDDDLAPKTGGTGPVRRHDSAALRRLEIGSWFDAEHPGLAERFAGTPLCTLAEVLDAFGDSLHYHVEIKSPEESLAALLLAEIGSRGLRDRVTITSFRSEPLVRVRRLDPHVSICHLIRRAERLREKAMDRSLLQDLRTRALQRRALERAAQRGFDQVAYPAQQLSRALVGRARELGISLRAWRVRTQQDLDWALYTGADGVTVDWPDRARERLALLQSAASD